MARFGRSRPKSVVPLSEFAAPSNRRDQQLGALARSLATAERLGIVVPDSFVVVADVFRHVTQGALPPGHDTASLLRAARRPVGAERAARARERLLSVPLTGDLERELDGAFRALSDGAPWGIAVRASAVLADQGMARAAGLSCTELPVFTRDELNAAIRRIWSRCASEATLGYLRARRMREFAIAVVLQPVVIAEASVTLVTDARAVLHTGLSDGALGPTARLSVAVAGLLTENVDLSEAESLLFDVEGNVQSGRAGSQQRAQVVRDRVLSFSDVGVAGPLISRARVLELAEIARRLDTQGGSVARCAVPAQGDVVLVDVRPLHHTGYPSAGSASTLWSRAAVTEAPAGPLTPLSRDLLARPIIERARRVLGPKAPRAAKLAGMLARIDGRPYLDLSRFIETDDPPEPGESVARIELAHAQWNADVVHEPVWRTSLARAGLRIAQIATEQRALSDEVLRFEREADQQRRWLAEMDLAILPDDALTTTLREVYDFLARAEALSVRSDALVLSGHGLLASVLAGVDPSRAAWLAHAVAAGADVVTARPAAAFCHVAAIARYDDPARDMVASGGASLERLPNGPLRRALFQFLDAFGDLGLSEAELAAPRWAEQTAPIFSMLAASLRGAAVDPEVALSRARALADRSLALIEPSLSFFETRLVRDIVSRQRDLLRLRERCRARVAHGLAMMRVVALDVDRRIRRLDPTLEAGAALHLTLEELAGAVSKYRADLAPIVRARRAEFLTERRHAGALPVFRGVPEPAYPARIEPLLRGLAASSGVGEGRVVRVDETLAGLDRFTPGDVLVVPTFDLGFAPLFFQASAIVAELGTPSSSSSVVARDCGTPAVTGLAGALVLLRDGERIRVDGDAGTVECLVS